MRVISDTRRPVKIWASDLEPEAEAQVRNMAAMPFIHRHVAVMPDAHAGKGSTVGTVIATRGAIIPAAVGVDIGCGMNATRLGFSIDRLSGDESLRKLRHNIERAVPTGRHGHTEPKVSPEEMLGNMPLAMHEDHKLLDKALSQCGTLGGGNHFIEICHDQENEAWLVLHSGSRNVGKTLAEIHINEAKDLMKRYFIGLPDPDLAYLVQGTKEFDAYVSDLHWAQRYAKFNRSVMRDLILRQVYRHIYGPNGEQLLPDNAIDCHHNYTQQENHFGQNAWVTRKGAVSARKNEWGIIPGSMGTKSYIVKGLGNEESFCSCSHGAGRRMSRTKARAMYTADDLAAQTVGVECPKTEGFVDEIPAAYKDIDVVMANQVDLVSIEFTLKQVICVKGST